MGALEVILMGLAVVAAVIVGVVLIVFLIVPVFKGIGWVLGQLWRFIAGEVTDLFRFVGAIILAILYVPVVLLNLIIGRWSACGHYGRALMHEVRTGGLCLYRMAVGHPLRLFKAEGLVEGLEQRLPVVVANAPTSDVPSGGRTGQFDGYRIIGSLAPGGSGARLYVAEPDAAKRAALARQGHGDCPQVVIKTFSSHEGSSLPQIVRESRSLDAAKRLGLILDHELSPERFYYVMRFVPGEPLSVMTKNLHAGSPAGGLGDAQLRSALGYTSDLVSTLATYHRGGLWHKDVKPDNVIVDTRGVAHLVDFGLVTSLRSAMTLTTHGTEYFRDPEMVRLALRGVKVHEVDGTRFDVYGAGAVLYSLVEDGFPAYGGLSQVTKRCPESVKWIIRRAMADYDRRYVSAEAMLADLSTVLQSPDPFAVRPADLPSVRGGFAPVIGDDESPRPATPPMASHAPQAAPTPVASPVPPAQPSPRSAPAISVVNWWSGRSQAHPAAGVPAPGSAEQIAQAARDLADQSVRFARHAASMVTPGVAVAGVAAAGTPRVDHPRRPAAEQLASARERIESARRRSRTRLAAGVHGGGWNGGVLLAVVLLVGALTGGALRWMGDNGDSPAPQATAVVTVDAPSPPADAPVPQADGDVLIVSDVLQPWSDAAGTYLRGLAEELRRAGLSPRGNLPGEAGVPTPVSDADKDLIAGARLALGAAPLDGPDAGDRLRAFLASHADQARVLVWVTPDPSRQSPLPRALIVTTAEENEDALAAAQAAVDRTRGLAAPVASGPPEPPAPPKSR
jgi:serine/threonine protein kinase